MQLRDESRNQDLSDPDIAGRDEKVFKIFLGQTGPPAFMRRAQRVMEAEEQLLTHCRSQRDELLVMVRTRLGMLRALCGKWEKLAGCVTSEGIETLETLVKLLDPPTYGWMRETASKVALAQAVGDLNDSIQRFNQRWHAYVQQLDLTELNEMRENYNRYYVLEKECIMRSPRLARQGFTPLPPITHAQLAWRIAVIGLEER